MTALSRITRFHYLMDLHYSQTILSYTWNSASFHYLMDLHYSQTRKYSTRIVHWFHYLMDLHYSQTRCLHFQNNRCFTTLWIYTILKHTPAPFWTTSVSLPYGFTLFSNQGSLNRVGSVVSLPYGFTLFSNQQKKIMIYGSVSLPYGFTLFSNRGVGGIWK